MAVNRECVVGTRPWKVSGEGPASASAQPLRAEGFNEGTGIPFTVEDVRFTTKGDVLYAIVLGRPKGAVRIESLGRAKGLLDREVASVSLVGGGAAAFRLGDDALTLVTPEAGMDEIATAFRIELR